MLLVATELRPSQIHGIGLFFSAPIKKGTPTWRFDERIDRMYADEEFAACAPQLRAFLETYSTWSRASGVYVLCGDNARFVNHSPSPTCASQSFFGDDCAARDIEIGEEYTNDYSMICDSATTLDYVNTSLLHDRVGQHRNGFDRSSAAP